MGLGEEQHMKQANWKRNRTIIILAVLLCAAILAVMSLTLEQQIQIADTLMIFLVMYPCMGLTICFGLLFSGNLPASLMLTFSFLPVLLLRWWLPDGVRKILYCVPLICFLVGLSYCPVLFNADALIEKNFYYSVFVSFCLCFLPALMGLFIGSVVKEWRQKSVVN